MTPSLKRRLDAKAEQGGRSQSQEAEFRLERSFEQEGLLPEILTLAFGNKHTAGLVWLLGVAMDAAGKAAQEEMSRRKPGGGPTNQHWLFDDVAYKEATGAANAVLRLFGRYAPSPELEKARRDNARRNRALVQSGLSIRGTEVAKQLIERAFAKPMDGSVTAETAATLREFFGPQIAKRFQNLEDFLQGRETARTVPISDPRKAETVARAVFELLMSKQKTPSQEEIAKIVDRALKGDSEK
jgi:hypothetical protein